MGLRTRPTRAVLSAIGIAIGIAAMIAVVGISTSSRAQLQRTLDQLGTNLLTATPGNTLYGGAARLPTESVEMVRRIGPVESATAIGQLPDVKAYRNDRIPAGESGGIGVYMADLGLLDTVGAQILDGVWLNAATARYPAVVLGSKTASRLGITDANPDSQIWVSGRWFTIVGILAPVPLTPELDLAVLMGSEAATTYFGFDGHPTQIYTRATKSMVADVRAVLAAATNPQHPNEVKVSQPSDALAAEQATDQAFTGLLLGLGAVALLVGGIGVANTMVISVLERRSEVGLRRSLGATRGQIRVQFLAESLLLSALGGITGVLLGTGVTGTYAFFQEWPAVVPGWALAGGVGTTLLVGGMAGLYPAIRAARLAPTAALGSA
ncbi:ABC transporter permease [Micromonospora sp. NBC_01412]|uniref:ABC transporter permease n=1 Tax=Micromonospora sp. NBC_01412 TaxID=2903590 RepID=UPI0038643DB9